MMEKAPKKDYLEIPMPRVPKIAKNNLFTIVVVVVLMGMSFALGSLYTKTQYLEQNSVSIPSKTATTISEELSQYAKQLGLNQNQFSACLSQGKYDTQITADSNEASALNVNATPAFFINGIFLGGAYPYESFKEIIDKELAGNATENYLDYSQTLQKAYEDSNAKSFDPVKKTIQIGNAPVRGNNNAKVTIIEYSDFQCPFCERAFITMNQILSNYKNQVKLIYKQLPLTSLHPNAKIAAQASMCANEQSKFWQYHDLLFKNQQTWSPLPQTAAVTP
jgi:protein-disulfide isomerase